MKSTLTLLTILITLSISFNSVAQSAEPKLKITHLTGDLYVYTTYNLFGKDLFPSNSMYLVTAKGIILFDTPWDTTQLKPLLDSLQARHQQQPVLSISTHFHSDRTAGLNYLSAHGVKTYSTFQTFDLCKKKGEELAAFHFVGDTTFQTGGRQFEVFYPGPGHAPDNIVIWFPHEKVLYGGCFVKSTEATSLGNLSDANVKEWPGSLQKVMKKFPAPIYVIPGHEGWSNNQSLQHTLQLLKAHKP